VLVSIVHGIPTSYLTTAEASMQATATIAFTAASGVGDQAYTYSYNITSGTALGIIAVKGTTFVGISCTGTTTTLSKVEAYASQLLG
jgi:xanthine/uracil/vitamin C permease (AzgA family)